MWLVPTWMLGNFYPDSRLSALAVAIGFCFLSSYLLVYLRVRAESIFAPALMRASVLSMTAPAIDLSFGQPDWVRPMFGVSALGAMLVVLALFFVHDLFLRKLRSCPRRSFVRNRPVDSVV
ncbi:MAG: hypothetical protein R3A47_00345 [Polyangiales bacterium]